MQRVTAVAVALLGAWFAWSVPCLVGADHGEFVAWMARPLNSVLLVLLVGSGFYHGWLGIRVVVEDYVQAPGPRTVTLAVCAGIAWLAAAGAGLAVLRAGYGGL
jgi:succinate dehydrogenase / fumarate reductase membrane anchor subunit